MAAEQSSNVTADTNPVREIKAPWSEEQVKNLREFQVSGAGHPFEGSNGPLIPTVNGWVEAEGGPVVQDWAYAGILDGSQVRSHRELMGAAFGAGSRDRAGKATES